MNSHDSLKPYNSETTLRGKVEAALEKIVAGVPAADLNLSDDVKREIDRLVRIAKMKHGVTAGRRAKRKNKS